MLSIFFFPSGCCFSVNCFQLITRSLTHYSSLLSSSPAAAAAAAAAVAPSSSASPPSVHPALDPPPCSPFPRHLHISLSLRLCLSLSASPLLSALQELKEFSWDQVRTSRAFRKVRIDTTRCVFVSTFISGEANRSESRAANLHRHQMSSRA